jgi:hypothetical protein
MALNAAQVKSLKPEPGRKVTRIHDGLGLYLFITSKSQKWWRFKYRFAGKNQLLDVALLHKVTASSDLWGAIWLLL